MQLTQPLHAPHHCDMATPLFSHPAMHGVLHSVNRPYSTHSLSQTLSHHTYVGRSEVMQCT